MNKCLWVTIALFFYVVGKLGQSDALRCYSCLPSGADDDSLRVMNLVRREHREARDCRDIDDQSDDEKRDKIKTCAQSNMKCAMFKILRRDTHEWTARTCVSVSDPTSDFATYEGTAMMKNSGQSIAMYFCSEDLCNSAKRLRLDTLICSTAIVFVLFFAKLT
ncbi:UNVERIFIED_CONTAM: hypothetical protein RMT77_009347 [Armadillidium vulgare]